MLSHLLAAPFCRFPSRLPVEVFSTPAPAGGRDCVRAGAAAAAASARGSACVRPAYRPMRCEDRTFPSPSLGANNPRRTSWSYMAPRTCLVLMWSIGTEALFLPFLLASDRLCITYTWNGMSLVTCSRYRSLAACPLHVHVVNISRVGPSHSAR